MKPMETLENSENTYGHFKANAANLVKAPWQLVDKLWKAYGRFRECRNTCEKLCEAQGKVQES